jgi:O-antigen/teichoic acid export membrane protein
MAAQADTDVTTTGLGLPKSPIGILRQLRSNAVRRMSWGLADQVVSSLTNFAVSIYVVHALGAVQFGAFSLAYVTYGFVLTASRGIATDPLLVRFSGTDLLTWRRAVVGSTGTATVMGLVTGACVLAAGAVLHGVAGRAFLALGLTLPGLLLQDSWRYSFFALGRGSQAFLNDTIWALTLLPAIVVLRILGHADVFWCVFAWGIAGNIAAAVGPWQARVIPRPASAWRWVSEHRDLGPRYFAQGTAQNAGTQIRAYAIGLVLGLAALGSVQAAATLFGPMTILFLGMALVTLPEAARVLRRSPRHLPLFCMVITAGLSGAALAWGIILLIAVPRGFGNWLLGPIWRSTYPLVLPQMLFVIGQGIGAGYFAGLAALGAAHRSLRQSLFASSLFVIGSLVGALEGGAAGTLWGAAASQWISVVYGWVQLREAMRDAGHLQAGHRYLSILPRWRRRNSPVPTAMQGADLTVPGDTVWRDWTSVAGASSPASPAPRLLSTLGTSETRWRPEGHTETRPPSISVPPVRRVKISAAAARMVLATGGIALLAVIAVTGKTLVHDLKGTHRAADAYVRTTPAPVRASASGRAPTSMHSPGPAQVLKPVSAVSFDPYGNGHGENNQLAHLAIDGNPATAWQTEWYTSASFGGLKPGTGLLLDMGRTVSISAVRLLLGSTPGADFQVRVGAVASSLTDLHPVAHASDAGGQMSLQLTAPARGRYVLIWFTQLPPDTSGTFQASVYNVSLEGWA